ncbi:MAG TPA: Wzz/FepE/Etk N-terminal domain-containing protein [Candidatus Dormibacteraeota bacterium]|nr:Wzz/FepE/Etk N-terminal domain-containing protein [Candidatus Dormibacteraeota bacterium]
MRDLELITWRDIVDGLRRRQGLILRVGGVGLLLMALVAMVMPPTYEATATLLVSATRSRSISPDAEAMPLVDRVEEEDLNSQAELLQSAPLIRRVLEPQLDQMPERGLLSRIVRAPRELVRALHRLLHGVPTPSPLDEWVDDVGDHLNVAVRKKTNLIDVAYRQRGVDPAWATAFVNGLIDAAINQQAAAGQQEQASSFFEEQRKVLMSRVQSAEQAKREFFAREGIDAVPEQRALLRTRLTELNVGLQDAEAGLASTNARVASLQREIHHYPATVASEVRRAQNQAVQFIKPRVLEKEMERNELLSLYAPTSDRVQDIERELAEAHRLLDKEQATVAETTTTTNPTYQTLEGNLAQATVDAASQQAHVDALRGQIESTRGAIDRLDRVAAENGRLDQELAAANEAYLTYTRKQEQARLGSALDASRIVNIAVVEPAVVPDRPARSHGLLLVILAGILSPGLGFTAAVVLELLDPTIRGARDAEAATGLPVLGSVPV